VCSNSLSVIIGSANLPLSRPRRHIGTTEVRLHSFLSSARQHVERATSRPCRLAPREGPRYTSRRKVGGSQSRLDVSEIKSLVPTGIRTLDDPASSFCPPPREEPRYTFNRRVYASQSRLDVSEIKSLVPTGIRTLDDPASSLCP